ncbi:MAG: glycosyltransferase family 2 protein [Deltaproteobacteria bacterium]|nr:glycosyltransferase family 2 protein [Deltaproteobacteria bacterium]
MLHLGENVGFAKAANLGLAACARALILLLNDDTAPLPGFIDALRAAAAAARWLYQPRILLSDGSGRLDNTGHGLFPDGFNWARGREDHDSARPMTSPAEVGACSGAALLVHRDVLDAIGPFDEDLEAFGEDVDLSLRARRRGFPLVYVPEARIVHDLGATYGRYTPRKVFLVERNRVRAAIRSLPMSAVLTMPAWTALRLGGLAAASASGRGWSARVESGAKRAALRGLFAGVAAAPDALAKRRADADHWALGEWAMWGHLLKHRVRLRDVLR